MADQLSDALNVFALSNDGGAFMHIVSLRIN
jgi:hypothetical protein